MRLILVQIIFVYFVLSNWNFAADVRLEFNRAAGLVRNGKYEEAAELLRQTAAADDKDVAARSFAMLGQIDVINAKAAADNAEPQTENLTECLDKAEAHFADSLALQDRDDVRKNLEALRAWRAKTTAEREEAERVQNRSAELQKRIQTLANEQDALAAGSQSLTDEPASPKLFQQNYESAKRQNRLAEELTYLSQVPLDAADAHSEDWKAAFRQLPETQKTAESAAQDLTGGNIKEALAKQIQIRDLLHRLLEKQDNQKQEQQNQEQKNQDKSNQNQEKQNQEKESEGKTQTQQNQQEKPQHEQQDNQEAAATEAKEKADGEKERAERMLMQVRRKEQEADKRREQLKLLRQQADPVEKDW